MANPALSTEDLENILEAIRGAYEELTTLEADKEWYCTSGNLMEQLEQAIETLEGIIECGF